MLAMGLGNIQPRLCRILKLSFRNCCFLGSISDADLTCYNFPDVQLALCQPMCLCDEVIFVASENVTKLQMHKAL